MRTNIPCRTGCNQQVDYEHICFPDQFIYFLPKNKDGTIHKCPNFPIIVEKDMETSWSKEEQELQEKIDRVRFAVFKNDVERAEAIKQLEQEIDSCPNQFYRQYEEIESTSILPHMENEAYPDSPPPEKRKPDSAFYEGDLLNIQLRCVLFPSPFNFSPSVMRKPDLLWLAECYENLNKYECAIIARMIQDRISYDQGTKILELEKLKNNFQLKKIIKVDKSIVDIRDEDVRNVEKTIKKFIRKNFSIEDFKKINLQLFNELNKHREDRNETRTTTLGELDDVFERLTLGQCIMIINKLRKIEEFTKFTQIKREHIHRMEWLKENFRNENDHAIGNVEKEFTEEDKILAITYSKTIIDYMDKLELV
jgi:tetratricopeptide (TPR) repeat protein